MADVVHFRFRLRGGTAAEWRAANPVLLEREPGVETDTASFKIGDGVTPWRTLPYSGRNVDDVLAAAAEAADAKLTPLAGRVSALESGGVSGGGGGGLTVDGADPGTFTAVGGTMSLTADGADPGTFTGTVTAGDGTTSGPAAALPNTPFAVRWLGTAWEFTTLTAAKTAGMDERQTAWFIGNPTGTLPTWARPGDVWTQE